MHSVSEDALRLRCFQEREVENIKIELHNTADESRRLEELVSALRKEKAAGDVAVKSLDEYKKKAQAALKKVLALVAYRIVI